MAERLAASGWNAGLFDLATQLPLPLERGGNLLILDDREIHAERLRRLLRHVAKQPSPVPLRLLLVSRRPAEAWQQMLDTTGATLAMALPLKPLATVDSYALFRAARTNAACLLKREIPNTIAQQRFTAWVRQNSGLHRKPLYILAAAIDSLEESGWQKRSGKEILQTLVRREQSRLRSLAIARGWPKESLIRLQTLATIAQGLNPEAINALNQQPQLELGLPTAGLIDTLQSMGLLKGQRFPTIKPDILAATWVATTLQSRPDLARYWLGAALEQSEVLSESFQQLGNLIFDIRHHAGGEWRKQWLTQLVDDDPKRCKKFAPVLAINNLASNLAPIAAHCGALLVQQAKGPAEKARLLNNLSLDLAAIGDRAGGLKATQRAVEIYETLAAENVAAYAPALALITPFALVGNDEKEPGSLSGSAGVTVCVMATHPANNCKFFVAPARCCVGCCLSCRFDLFMHRLQAARPDPFLP